MSDLYGLPLAEFIPVRNAFAKELKAAGKRDEAEAVKKLAKPTVAAWAANQVLRTQGKATKELFAAGDALAKADAKKLRDAMARHREAVTTLLDAARGLLDPDGKSLSDATLERVQQTLHAASLDPALREEAEAGALTREHVFSGLPEKVGATKRKPAAKKTPAKPKRDAAAERKRKAYEAKLRAAEVAAAKAAGELEKLRRSKPS
jgi:cob(I)alamin adenosyltransferase